MIKQFENIPITDISFPYARAAQKCDFENRGFVEEEYFIHGTANVYETRDGKLNVAFPDAPYINRLLVRRPDKKEAFSGNVVVEIINSTNYMDIDRVWCLIREKVIRDGDIYIGLTSKPITIPVMKKLNYDRYERLSWKNPRKATRPDHELGNLVGASHGETEDGLLWDMLRDLPGALKTASDSPLKGFGDMKIYLSGWSQSGGVMIQFINTFAYMTEEEKTNPIYDGYFSTGAATAATPGINQEESPYATAIDPKLPFKMGKVYQPFMEIHTELENAGLSTLECRQPNYEFYRAYDIPGASHDTKDNMVDYYYLDPDLSITGIFPFYGGTERFVNDYPYNFIFHRALNMLFDWVHNGNIPPEQDLIKVDFSGKNMTDENGNAVGGWRTVFLEYPTATYFSYSTPLKPEFAFGCTCFGHKKPFSKDDLERRYKSLENYKELIIAMADKQVQDGWLEPADYNAYINLAVRFAEEGGLH